MGQEITTDHFQKRDFRRFEQVLAQETELLGAWFSEGQFQGTEPVVGFELEAWLVDRSLRPAPSNAPFLEAMENPLVVPELASFNIEFNGTPQPLSGSPFALLADELDQTWSEARRVASGMDLGLAMVGILPTIRAEDLTLANMSNMQRYRALNEQVMRMRSGLPLHFHIEGRDHLDLIHHDVMMEAGATSLQIHLQVPFRQSVEAFNAAIRLSAPMVALCANSPYLFGEDLWDDSRIPLFEQAVNVDPLAHSLGVGRVSFGTGYAEESLFEIFQENLDHYPVMLPICQPEPRAQLSNLMLHNGTIWRWNRPLVGFDAAGRPGLRIEHRVASAGPTPLDVVANSVFFVGLVMGMVQNPERAVSTLPFSVAKENFYLAARHGMAGTVRWEGGRRVAVRELLQQELLPLAVAGFEGLGLERGEWAPWLEIIEGRIDKGQNGALWQREWVAHNGREMAGLLEAYLQEQHSGNPVHQWEIDRC